MATVGLRVIGGRWRSRRLVAPPAASTKPMSDRVKEAVFDVLGSWLRTPGHLPPVQVLDLFAGSGALGIEAVSRGAVGCVFVERNARVVRVLRDNLDALQAEPALHIEIADAWSCPAAGLRRDRPAFGLVFVDPPYRNARDISPSGQVPALLDRITRGNLLTDEVVIVLHHEGSVRYQPVEAGSWTVADRRQYGGTAISFVIRAGRRPPEQRASAEGGSDEQAPVQR